jgi:secondary thiamine-phosphate synthase enzyme
MPINLNHIFLTTPGNTEIIDITQKVIECIASGMIKNGLVTIFCPSSTSGVTTLEYEEGVLHDLKRTFNEIVPTEKTYQHNEAWHDGNGHSHIRSALLKTSLSIPLVDGRMTLGTWQQVVFVDFDTRPRKREIIVQKLCLYTGISSSKRIALNAAIETSSMSRVGSRVVRCCRAKLGLIKIRTSFKSK